ncbi:hypothetical protein FA727_20405 [Robertmurraya kyonggiensis]|uniref:Uncharacterized protein n=2 Tax=Robertmurraya kyonggiensis TaxID=1037680 RepID=A0A4U1CYE6_9BACI|nr:hypothetical protein FA727_20405 [Robertmurraya kyonggiensis]
MMSLSTANLMETVKKQYSFKLKANIDAISSLVGIQLVAILFSLGGIGGSLSSSEGLQINFNYYSADVVLVFTMFWALVTAITITTKPYRNHDFTFVTNRLSSSLSNILFLLTGSLLGAVTANLSRYLLQLIAFLFRDQQVYSGPFDFPVFILGIVMSALYIFCVCSIGYLIGALVQVNKSFVLLVPVLIIGSIFLGESILVQLFQFYVMEPNFVFFLIKILITTALFFLASISILNRMEVRR